jgi:hypothetical protein
MVWNTTYPAFLWPLPTDGLDRILRVVNPCRPVLREVPGLGRGVSRAAVVVRSAKLVHQRTESGEAGMFSWPTLPVSDPRRFVHSTILPQHGAAMSQHVSVARCLLDQRWFTGRHPFVWRPSFLPHQQPLAPACEVASWHPVLQRRQRVRPEANDRSVENSSPPLSARAWLARRLKRPGGRSQAHHCPRP